MSVMIYAVLEASRDNPDVCPVEPPSQGSWVWWRTGPHPQGVWQAMDLDGSTKQGAAGYEAWRKNWDEHPIFQDRAFGDYGDWGNFACHACRYLSDGYPEPNHHTDCDGICKRKNCRLHGDGGRAAALQEFDAAVSLAISRGVSISDLQNHFNGLVSQPAEEPASKPGQ